MPTSIGPGDILAGRYRLEDLLNESGGGRFWRAHDRVLARFVAVHVIDSDDERAPHLLAAARKSVLVMDRRILRVLDAAETTDLCYVVNEWGEGTSLDILLASSGPLEPRRAAWIASEVGGAIASAHDAGVSHGRLVPENVLIDLHGSVRVIGLAVDAALHGLPQGRRTVDVADLAAVLYAGLTGRWAGVSPSIVPGAPAEAGVVLRPRKVRAGIPRVLDELCVDVLNPMAAPGGAHARAAYDLGTARGITDQLREFVGDPTPMIAAEARASRERLSPLSMPALGLSPAVDSGAADPAAGEITTGDAPVTAAAAEPPGAESTRPTHIETPIDQPTEAGLPIFDDDSGDVAWLTARASKPPPPPPFDEPPERPLFAPEPPPGTPPRRARSGVDTSSSSQELWPWEGDGPNSLTGTGPLIALEDEEPLPGRRSLRLAGILAAVALLVLAVAFASGLGRGGDPQEPDGSESASETVKPSPAAIIASVTAEDFDPQGDPPEENPDTVSRIVDGNPATTWITSTYEQNFGPAGLKTGVGVILDLGQNWAVRSADITFIGAPTAVEVYLEDTRPRGVQGLTPIATEPAVGPGSPTTLSLTFDDPPSGRYLTIWLTQLPVVTGGFRGEISEVVVRG